jgi:uncharacterized repeat protein (TIGR03806 family)
MPLVLAVLALSLALTGCGGGDAPATDTAPGPVAGGAAAATPDARVLTAAAAPEKLSAWQAVVRDGDTLKLGDGVVPYALNTALFADYAHKLRTLWIPPGSRIEPAASGPLQLPIGAVLTKTFYYPKAAALAAGAWGAGRVEQVEGGETVDMTTHHLVETRVMVRQPDGSWGGVTYTWDTDQRDATRRRDGALRPVELVSDTGVRTVFTYQVPTDRQCIECHATDAATQAFQPLGPEVRHLNRDYAYATGLANQLDHLRALQLLSGAPDGTPATTVWNDPGAPLEARARAYLDVHCASCHNPVGRAGHTGLWLGAQVTSPSALGVCKAPVGGQQRNRYANDIQPGDPDASFLYHRITSYRPGSQPPRVTMPELGRHVFDEEGNALIRAWIAAMPRGCP